MITVKQLQNKGIEATDGHIGSVYDVYFDDQAWTIRYLVVDTGKWLPGRKVLLATEVVILPWHAELSAVPVRLTMDEVRSSPDIDTTPPVSRESEGLLHSHYGWVPYWGMPGAVVPPSSLAQPDTSVDDKTTAFSEAAEICADPQVRSTKELLGYRVHATDGDAGHIGDILCDDQIRRALFLAVDLEERLPAKQVLIPSRLVLRVHWGDSRVDVDLPSRVIKASQEYKPTG